MDRSPSANLPTGFETGSRVMTMAPGLVEFDTSALQTTTVSVETMCGRSFEVEVDSQTPTMMQLREAVQAQLGIPLDVQRLLVDSKHQDDLDVIDVYGSRIQLMHNVFGGTGGNSGPVEFKMVTEIPEMIQLRCLCHKCGIKNFPDFMKEDWCAGRYFCLHSEVGLKDCMQQQCLCLLVSQDGIKTETAIPAAIQCRILLYKCGLTDFPNIKNEDCCSNACCCLHQECGLKDWQINQLLCLRCTVTGDAANII